MHALLSKALPEEEAEHLGAILKYLDDLDDSNRWAAVEALGKLEPMVLTHHVGEFSPVALRQVVRDQ